MSDMKRVPGSDVDRQERQLMIFRDSEAAVPDRPTKPPKAEPLKGPT